MQPYIIQLTFIIVNVYKINGIVKKHHIEKEYNNYIAIDKTIVIPEKITEITGITREICDTEGVDIIDLLFHFYKEYHTCNYIVSHNIAFDSKMMLIEFERNYHKLIQMGCETPYSIFNTVYNNIHNIKLYCTMLEGKEITNIYVNNAPNSANYNNKFKPYKKQPKLIELYKHLYPNEPEPTNLHNSLVDTLVCMKCFLKMKYIAFGFCEE